MIGCRKLSRRAATLSTAEGLVPPMTYQVFLLLLEKDAEPKLIAKRLGIALSSFYNHKKTALEAYRQILTELKELR